MKKILLCLFIVLCLTAFLGTTALAAGNPVMDFDLSVDGSNNVSVKTGDIITVTLVQTCSGDATVITEEDRVFFDHTFFEFVEGSNTAAIANYTTILSVDSIDRHFVYFNTIEDVEYKANTPVTIGTFQLKVIATSGSSEIRNTTNLANIKDRSLDTTAQNLIVTVEGSAPTKQTQDLSFAYSTVEKTEGDAAFVNPLTGAKTAVTYTSSNPAVATVAADGTVTIVGKGTATITAKAAENDTYKAAEVSYTLTVKEKPTDPPVTPPTPDDPDTPDTPDNPDNPDIPDMLNGAEHFAYIVGYDDGSVHPEANITRAEVATIFFRLLNEDVRSAYLTSTNNFKDVASGEWYNTPVSTMAAMGILKGYEGYFRPNDPITRAEFAAIAARFADKTGTQSVSFKDISGHWAEDEILKAASLGWVQGYNGYYRPNDAITRAEAMTLTNRVLCRVPKTVNDLLPGMRVWADNMDTSKWYYLAVQEATNSHTFVYKDDTYETWVALTADPDWSRYQ